ncbi:hypothetical protein ACQP60_17890 [Isoptericola variabilis]|uniref:hypothetical protein n=1 Tax=Isoptericola variabilis TaxID=139208 RepID=UPI003D1A69FC
MSHEGVVVAAEDATDPANLGAAEHRAAKDQAAVTGPDRLAQTGGDADLLAAASLIVLTGTGLVLAGRRRGARAEDVTD